MGYNRWDAGDWAAYTTTASTRTREELFAATGADSAFNPATITVRESRDSAANPKSTPLIVGIDVTGSMGELAAILARSGVGTLMQQLIERRPVSDPHLLCAALGDVRYDEAPLQVTQFETDMRITDQLRRLWIEGGGGGNNTESYDLAWAFAALKTSTDATELRHEKGYLFTVGDEEAPLGLTRAHLKEVLGLSWQSDLSAGDLMQMARRSYHLYHIVIEQGSYAQRALRKVQSSWQQLLGPEYVISLQDYQALAEVIVSTIQVHEGARAAEVAASWDSTLTPLLSHALQTVTPRVLGTGRVVRF